MHGLEEPGAGQMRQPSRVIAIGLVGRQRFERLVGLPALDADHGQTELAQPVEQDRRHSPSLEYDPTTTWRLCEFVRDRVCHRRGLAFIDNSALAIENADVRLVHRDVEASKIVHVGSPLPNRRRFYRPVWKSSRPLPDVEKPSVEAAAICVSGRLSARQIRATPPHTAKIGAGKGMSFASFRKFWPVAAKRNSSLAPLGPRRRNRSSLRMRFR